MDILLNIGINLLAALVGFGVGWIWQKIREELKFRGARRFWKPFSIKNALFVIPRRFKSQREQIGTVSAGTANGIMELNTYLSPLMQGNINIVYADRLEGDLLKSNLILIGGPVTHVITQEILSRTNSILQFKKGATGYHTLCNAQTGEFYETSFRDYPGGNNLKEVEKDYAMILKRANPFDQSKLLLVIAGNFDYATWAGVRFVMSKQFIENESVVSNQPVEALIEADIVRGSPQSIKLIFLEELK